MSFDFTDSLFFLSLICCFVELVCCVSCRLRLSSSSWSSLLFVTHFFLSCEFGFGFFGCLFVCFVLGYMVKVVGLSLRSRHLPARWLLGLVMHIPSSFIFFFLHHSSIFMIIPSSNRRWIGYYLPGYLQGCNSVRWIYEVESRLWKAWVAASWMGGDR